MARDAAIPRWRGWVKKLLLVGVSTAVGFLLVELLMGAFFYSNVELVSDKEWDEELGWRLRPGTYSIKAPDSFARHSVYINEHGLRNRDIDLARQPDKRRVLVLGDSFTFGVIVSGEALFTSQLERKLNEGGGGYEVVNAGVPGYGNAQQLLWLRRLHAMGLTADTYLLCMYTNDILDNLCLDYGSLVGNTIQPKFELDPEGALVLTGKPRQDFHRPENSTFVAVREDNATFKTLAILKANMEKFVQKRPGLVRLAGRLGLKVRPRRVPGVINAWYARKVMPQGPELTQALLAEIRREVESKGGELLVCFIPSPVQVYDETYAPMIQDSFPNRKSVKRFYEDPMLPQRTVGGICGELGIPYLDLYPSMRSAMNRGLYVPREGHFSPAGHEVAAESMKDFVLVNS